MKSSVKILAGLAAVALTASLQSCNEVPESARYVELPALEETTRAVLLEDFTGQNCVNCPEGHEKIEKIVEQFGADRVIAVSIHCGDFGISVDRTNFETNNVGLMTEEGNSICAAYGINQWPMGVVDMGSPINMDYWATEVRKDLQLPTDINIHAEANLVNASGENKGEIEIKATILSGSDRTAKVQFWIVEDGIVARQKNLETTIKDYVHNNVFRGQVFPGIRGQEITLTKNIDYIAEGTIAVRWTDKEHWNTDNISVVAFVSDNSGVLNVVRVPVK